MEIQSGTTSWWRNRHLLFVGMLVAFAGWFGYDGFIKYPQTNRKWAAEAIGIPPTDVQINPLVQGSTLDEINKELSGRTVSFNDLVAVHEKHLGKPTYEKGDQHWWVGPALYIKLDPAYFVPETSTSKAVRWREISEPPPGSREGQIRGQKIWALCILVVAALVALKLVRVMSTRVVLNDAGLRYNGRSIPWEAMTGLRIDDFQRKYWVDLEYTANDVTRSIRLDSLHIDKFNEIVGAICERKGFASPLAAKGPKTEAEGGGELQG